MSPNRAINPTPKFLTSWKEIATYMGKGVRTVQRYEAQLGLPVRRPAGKARASVLATCVEIDAWVAASPIRNTFRLTPGNASNDPELVSIRKGIKEMHSLREQMAALRVETNASLHLLIKGVQSLRAASAHKAREQSDELLDEILRATGSPSQA